MLRDPVSASTHLAMCVWAVFATLVLWRLCRHDGLKRWTVGCFGLTMILLYGASGTYHALTLPPEELWYFRMLDHSAIYVLIAGTYTPIFAVLLHGWWRASLLTLMWVVAAVGIACKWLLPDLPYPVTVSLYLGMGWLGALPTLELFRAVGLRGLAWGLGGGLLYSAGAVCDIVNWPVLYAGVFGSHEMVHLFDMAGTAAHFIFVVRYVVPYPGRLLPAGSARLRVPLVRSESSSAA